MFTCSICGQPGGSYCPTVEEHGTALEGFVHPHCYALKGKDEGIKEATTLQRFRYGPGDKTRLAGHRLTSSFPIGRSRLIAFPGLKKNTLHKVRL